MLRLCVLLVRAQLTVVAEPLFMLPTLSEHEYYSSDKTCLHLDARAPSSTNQAQTRADFGTCFRN